MSDDLYVFSETLALAEAKKLLAAMQKPPKGGAWQDWSGDGGFETEVKRGALSGYEVGQIDLPAFVSSTMIRVNEIRPLDAEAIPETLFLGGDDWKIPEYDGDTEFRISLVTKELNHPLSFSFSKDTNMRFHGRKYHHSESFGIYPSSGDPKYPIKPPNELVEDVIDGYRQRFQFSDIKKQGFLEDALMTDGGFYSYFDPKEHFWLRKHFRKMIETLVTESSAESFKMLVQTNIGVHMKFHGEVRNIREDAQELFKQISERNTYSSYDITYYVVGPQTWRGREKSRKKWKQPIYQELGTATLENGTTTTARLTIEKEGYVFTLDFEDADALAAFRETKLFKKTQWNLGAE